MKKCFGIHKDSLPHIKEGLHEIGVEGMTVSEVRGHGRQKGHTETYRGREYEIDLLPKTKIEMVLPENLVDGAVGTILKTAKTGKIGDGKRGAFILGLIVRFLLVLRCGFGWPHLR